MHRLLTVGVLALQGAYLEHLNLLRQAAQELKSESEVEWQFAEIRTPDELSRCDALTIPGGESTTMALVAVRSGLLEPLREFVNRLVYHHTPVWWDTLDFDYALLHSASSLTGGRVNRKPTWGTCAGLILLAEAANRTKKGGQDLIGGLDVKVDRNHFGRQKESFEADLDLPFLVNQNQLMENPFRGIFIRAPIVERVMSQDAEKRRLEYQSDSLVTAPSPETNDGVVRSRPRIEILGMLPGRKRRAAGQQDGVVASNGSDGDIVAIKQGHVFGTSFHPELTQDPRIHVWWLREILHTVQPL